MGTVPIKCDNAGCGEYMQIENPRCGVIYLCEKCLSPWHTATGPEEITFGPWWWRESPEHEPREFPFHSIGNGQFRYGVVINRWEHLKDGQWAKAVPPKGY